MFSVWGTKRDKSSPHMGERGSGEKIKRRKVDSELLSTSQREKGEWMT